ncbi:hypothetical protein WR25_14967 [Diploscapter pachys]|uniref:Uncharacterized protein n=1 Tax=Diploscapter pachys TaxID=2018661 RepID=A0A2A2LS89_9BILA|nr:hypothetical protein WR25_14967 [Diploscapter pachys]
MLLSLLLLFVIVLPEPFLELPLSLFVLLECISSSLSPPFLPVPFVFLLISLHLPPVFLITLLSVSPCISFQFLHFLFVSPVIFPLRLPALIQHFPVIFSLSLQISQFPLLLLEFLLIPLQLLLVLFFLPFISEHFNRFKSIK